MEIETNSCAEPKEISISIQTEEPLEVDLKEINLDIQALQKEKDGHSKLYFAIIQTAIEDYIDFGIKGKKQNDVEAFYSAYNYLFVTRSQDQLTWLTREKIEGIVDPTEDQLKLMCFDVHFDYAKLGIKKSVLLTLIRKEREKRVALNYSYAEQKMNSIRRNYLLETKKRGKVVNYDRAYLTKALIEPKEAVLCKLYFGE